MNDDLRFPEGKGLATEDRKDPRLSDYDRWVMDYHILLRRSGVLLDHNNKISRRPSAERFRMD